MQTLKRFLLVLMICLMAFLGFGATIQWYSQQPAKTSINDTDIIAVEVTGPQGYRSVTFTTIKNYLGTNGASTQIITNLIVQNLYSSNAYVTNLTVLNEFHGKTTITTNLYVDYVTNNISYITNLFLTEQVTNYFLFSTNIYISNSTNNTYISNYFQTNVFQNTYMSNFFNTNTYLYVTNNYHYSTNLTVTNFYAGDTFVSNFFNTNIFVVDNTVSNFFETNIYNTINISSNYTYQFDLNPTNLTMYGNTWIVPYEGNPNPSLQIINGLGSSIFLDGSLGDIGITGTYYGSVFSLYEDTWSGPTNSISALTSDQRYTTTTDCSITGFTDFPSDPTQGWAGLLSITNANAGNIVLRFPSSIMIPERTNAVTISNGSLGMLSIKWTHNMGTQGVYRQF